MVPAAHGLVRIPYVPRPDRILPCRRPPVRARRRRNVGGRVRGEVCPSPGPRCSHREARRACVWVLSPVSACPSTTVRVVREGPSSSPGAPSRSGHWSPARRCVHDADARHDILVDDDARRRGKVDSERANGCRCGRIGDNVRCTPRVRHADRAGVRVLLTSRRERTVVAAGVYVNAVVFRLGLGS